jgi:tRNA modification GTPase
MFEVNDTICAISTPEGNGAIGIIRISGKNSLDIIKKIFKSNKKIQNFESHNFYFGKIFDPSSNNVIDDCYVVYFKSPKSYTKEDMVEINCHGNHILVKKILSIILNNGAHIAQPGEFTKRAYLAGRFDLIQAEAIANLIQAKNEKALSLSYNILNGKLSEKILDLKEKLLDLTSNLIAELDFPEEEIDSNFNLVPKTKELISLLDKIINKYDESLLIKNGARIAICGAPNVGKSSLFNSLINYERSIVTDIPGTTRDVISNDIIINGVAFTLFDTAGVAPTKDILVNLGIDKTFDAIKNSDIVLFLVDISQGYTDIDKTIENKIDKKYIKILNKIDLVKNIKGFDDYVKISAKVNYNLDFLKQKIYDLLFSQSENCENEFLLINYRQKELLQKAKQNLEEALIKKEENLPCDLLSLSYEEALKNLGEITGEITSDDILNHIFSKFCIGK